MSPEAACIAIKRWGGVASQRSGRNLRNVDVGIDRVAYTCDVGPDHERIPDSERQVTAKVTSECRTKLRQGAELIVFKDPDVG